MIRFASPIIGVVRIARSGPLNIFDTPKTSVTVYAAAQLIYSSLISWPYFTDGDNGSIGFRLARDTFLRDFSQ
jgi:hypothetical protein